MADLIDRQAAITTAEEYRQRMIQAFHNADCDELISVVCLPTEKEFEHLEWLLKAHYKKEPCEDTISRQAVLALRRNRIRNMRGEIVEETINVVDVEALPSAQQWIPVTERLPENNRQVLVYAKSAHFALAKYDEMREADGTYKMQWVTFDAWKPFYTIKDVIAWMPLPKPWEGGEA